MFNYPQHCIDKAVTVGAWVYTYNTYNVLTYLIISSSCSLVVVVVVVLEVAVVVDLVW